MFNLEKQQHNFELSPDTKVQVVAVLEDVGGSRYFIRTEQGQYFSIGQNKEQYEEVDESTVASAIIKHGYKPIADGQVFEFGRRKEVLKGI